MRRIVYILSLVMIATLFACNDDHTEADNITPPPVEESDGEDDESDDDTAPAISEEGSYVDLDRWELSWSDEFDGTSVDLEKWDIEDGDGVTSHILSNRWKENVEVKDGVLRLVNKKETTTGVGTSETRQCTHDYTSGNVWTKESYKYGYYECRYKYAGSNAINNAFWFMGVASPSEGKYYEIDVNEGHYPNEINMNLHNRSNTYEDGSHEIFPLAISYGTQVSYSYQLENEVTTTKVRLVSDYDTYFHIPEFTIYAPNAGGYPDPLSETAHDDVEGLVDHVRDDGTEITVSGIHETQTWRVASNVKDGKFSTTWLSQTDGQKWIEFEFDTEKTIGCVQFLNGYLSDSEWRNQITDFKIQYDDNGEWVDIATLNSENADVDLSKDLHTYGLEWSATELIYYFDGEELYRLEHDFCLSASPIRLSTAVISWSGSLDDPNLDGSAMEVDFVRFYEPK